MTDQELAVLFKWTICNKYKAMERSKAVEIEPCICNNYKALFLERWEKRESLTLATTNGSRISKQINMKRNRLITNLYQNLKDQAKESTTFKSSSEF